jgi:hypothetical protein
MTPTQAITAAEALLLLEGLCDNRVDWLTNWVGRQEVQEGGRRVQIDHTQAEFLAALAARNASVITTNK